MASLDRRPLGRLLVLPLTFCTLLGGCAVSQPSRSHERVQVPGETVVVIASKRVRIPSESLTPAIVGATVGYFAGPKLFALQSKLTVGTGIANVAGAAAGAYGAPYLFSDDGIEVVVRRSNGEKVAIVQPRNGWNPMIGQEATLVSTAAGPRIVRD